ncbi:MAG TPA: GspE/PulE family protein, partial [Longimicrobiales bacterium]
YGILLATGPTGSGKTTTLYAALKEIHDPGVKIVAVEDPVEYQIDGVTQIPVHPAIGLSFASVLRSILRHDPDVIMVGEMRDRETAEIAIQSALTGHLVLSTLHTNDAASGVTRLLDMGIEPFLVTATVRGILAQRLVRTICSSCAQPYEANAAEKSELAQVARTLAVPPTLRRGTGCPECAGTGYRGRTGIFEVLSLTDEIRKLIIAGAAQDAVRAAAREHGMTTLRECGLRAACMGITTVDEVLRVTGVL